MRSVARVAVAAAVIAASMASASPAMATKWGSSSNPYIAYSSGGSTGFSVAKGYGDFYNDNQQYARDSSYQFDYLPSNGNSVYVYTEFSFWIDNEYSRWSAEETDRTSSASWVSKYERVPLNSLSDKARGTVKVCEDQAWSGDPCSPPGLPGFSY